MYRCAETVPAPPFAERGSCNPDYDEADGHGRQGADAAFSLETESAKSLQARMTAGTLTAETLTEGVPRPHRPDERGGPGDPGRPLREHGRDRATRRRSTASGRRKGPRGPLHGIPVLLDDSIDVKGLPTTGGSIALQDSKPDDDSTIVAKLKAAGAIILGKTNVSELNGAVRREHARGVLVARRPGAAAVRHGQDAGRLVRRLGGGDGLRPGGDDRRDGDVTRHGAADRAGRRRRRRRPQADGRARQPRRRAAGGQVAGLARPDHPDGLRRGACSCRRSPARTPPIPRPRARRPRRTTWPASCRRR